MRLLFVVKKLDDGIMDHDGSHDVASSEFEDRPHLLDRVKAPCFRCGGSKRCGVKASLSSTRLILVATSHAAVVPFTVYDNMITLQLRSMAPERSILYV
jgi:hypothetical protein